MCFMHAPFAETMTRGEAMMQIAALGALPVMPALGIAHVHETNAKREYTAIVGATALIGPALTPLSNATILLRGNKIEAVGPAQKVTIPASALRLNAHGMFAIPGLIDSHVHFFQSGGLYTRPDAIDLRSVRPYTDELAWIRSNLNDTFARYLRAGITSVVDVGGPFFNYDVRAMAEKTHAAPRVMVAGPLISSVEREILNPHNDPPIVKIDTFEQARALIDRELAVRTDFVKFWWVVTAQRPAIAFQPVAKAAIDYAHSKGARVVIHATELETARLAVESGTDILAHSVFDTDVDDAFVSLLQAHKTIYCPTLNVVGNYGYTFAGKPNLTPYDLQIANPDVVGTLFHMKDVEGTLPAALLARIRALRVPEPPHAAMRNLKRLHDAGISIAAGTDAGNIGTQHASSFYDEALTMAASGLSPKEILRSATAGGALMMGRAHDLGTIEQGKLADIVLLKENPLNDVRALGTVAHVIKDGHLFEARSMLSEPPEYVVQRAVNAYNFHDAEVFAESYAPDAVVIRPGSAPLTSRAAIAAAYRKRFTDDPQVHAEIIARTVSGNTIVDKEHASGFTDGRTLDITATYHLKDGLISRAEIVF